MLEPEMIEFIAETAKFYPANAVTRPIAEQRRLYDCYAAHMAVSRPAGLACEDAVFGPHRIGLRAYLVSKQARRGIIIYLHGGGFVVGGLDSHDMIAARLAVDTGARVIAVGYRLAPEYPFPAAFDDCLSVVRAALNGSLPFRFKPTSLVLAGDSAGANLCAAVSLTLCTTAPANIKGLILIYPALASEPTPPARDDNAEAPILTLADLRWYNKAYLGNCAPTSQSSPLLAESFVGMPSSLLLPVEFDPLRDDAFSFHERLIRDGVKSELMLGRGLVHGSLRALGRSPGVDALVKRAVLFARDHLTE